MTRAHAVGRIPEITLHHRLRIARETAGLDQGQLAEMVGVSRNSIGNAESGKHAPRKILINAWALATGVPAYWLETGETPHPNGPGEGSLLPHLDSNQKPAGLQPQRSDQHVFENVFPLPGTPSRNRPAAASPARVSSATSEVAAA